MTEFEQTANNAKSVFSELDARFLERSSSFSKANRPFMIAIDGRCASGKTTLASMLVSLIEEKYPYAAVELFHMDDFYLRVEQRTKKRYSEPGGNVDRERFFHEVIEPLYKGEAFSYRPFVCEKMALGDPIFVKKCDIAIIEGSYSCHPELIGYYDLRVFMSIEKAEQQRRILKRNGEEKLAQFNARWIPLEEAYFEFCRPELKCDINLKN